MAPIALGAAVANTVCTYLATHPGGSVDLEIGSRRVDLLAGSFDTAIVPGHVDDTTDFVARAL